MDTDKKWMYLALKEAEIAESKGEVPVGAVLIQNDKLVAKAHNNSILNNDASAHAEIQLIRKAGIILNNYRLTKSVLYVTLEPCAMCLGAIVHARIEKIVFGAPDPKSGVCGSCKDLTSADFFNHKVSVYGGVLENQCRSKLTNFFQRLR